MSAQLPGVDAGPDQRSVDALRAALSPTDLLAGIRRDWPDFECDGRELLGCEPIRVHPRGRDAFVIDYTVRLSIGGQQRVQPIIGELVNDVARDRCVELVRRLHKPRRGQLTEDRAGASVGCIPSLGLVLRVPGLDERLPGLKLFHQPALLAGELRRCGVDWTGGGADTRAHLLGHRLGKRSIVRFRSSLRGPAPSTAIAKMYKYHADRGPAVAEVMCQLRHNGFDGRARVRVPEPLVHLPAYRTLLMAEVPGNAISELDRGELVAGVAAAGRALARLHRCPVRVGETYDRADELALLGRWVTLVAAVKPELRISLDDALSAVTEGFRRCSPGHTTLVHRDFYDKQVLVSQDVATLIDFDTLCMSEPALDIGNFVAHLRFERPQSVAPLEAAFLDGYGAQPSVEGIRCYTRSTLLRLVCIHAFCARQRINVERALATLCQEAACAPPQRCLERV